MKIIVAQGNPGQQYQHTRHNISWLVLDQLAGETKQPDFQLKTKFSSLIMESTFLGEKVLLVKPQTFYNETGLAVRAIVDFYKINLKDVLVIHDDLALDFGVIRTRIGGSDGGNNGIKSLNTHLGKGFPRIRLGINSASRSNLSDSDYVLSRFSSSELEVLLETVIPKTLELIINFLNGDFEADSFKLI